MGVVTLEELRTRQTEIRARLAEIDAEFAGEALPSDTEEEWQRLNEEHEENVRLIQQLEVRKHRLEELAQDDEHREEGAHFYVGRTKSEADIFDLTQIRSNVGNPSEAKAQLRDNAMRAIEIASFPHPAAKREEVQSHLARLLDTRDDAVGSIARHMLATGSNTYMRAFGKYISGQPRTAEEERALSLTTSSGGNAVPYVLDPTIIPTSDLAVNPFRAIARVEQITVDEWRGVPSAGVSASWDTEAAEVSDDTPTIGQTSVSTFMARAFVPYSIEIGMDWSGLQTEMARLIQDAKDTLEATAFATGNGTTAPQGIVTGATATVTPSTGGEFYVADVYALEADLGPRFRTKASFVMNRAIAQKIRQFDTAGGAQLWIDNLQLGLANQVPTPGSVGARLLGYGAYESSAMSSTVTTGEDILILGDFNYYVIADRVGLSLEYIPHLFATANNRPSGQRGLFAYWRVGAGVQSTSAFRMLEL